MKQRQFSQYLKWLALVTVCLLLLISGFNWLVNPYDIYGSPRIEGFNAAKPEFAQHLRMAKAYVVRRIKPDAIVLGTSSAEAGIEPGHAGWSYSPVYNLALSGANIYEMTRYFQHTNTLHPLKQAVLMLDFFSFNIYKGNRSDFDETRLSVSYDGKSQPVVNVNDTLSQIASFDALRESIKTITHQKDEGSNYLGNGMLKDRNFLTKDGYRASFAIAEEAYMTSTYVLNQFDFTNSEAGQSSFNYYRKTLQTAYQDNIDLRIAISPGHVRQWETVGVVGLWPKLEEWKRMLIEINEEEANHAGKSPFPLWDFGVYNEFTTEDVPAPGDTTTTMQWFWDPSHYKKELGSLILDRMFLPAGTEKASNSNLGVLLTSENIDGHLQKIRADSQHYRDTHLGDIAEIEALAEKLGVLSKR